MKFAASLAETAAKRLEERRKLQSGPLAAVQKALWEALMRGDIDEAMQQADIVERIRGPQPPSPVGAQVDRAVQSYGGGEQDHQGVFAMKVALQMQPGRVVPQEPR